MSAPINNLCCDATLRGHVQRSCMLLGLGDVVVLSSLVLIVIFGVNDRSQCTVCVRDVSVAKITNRHVNPADPSTSITTSE